MKVLVTFAVEQEFAPWRTLRHFVSIPGAGGAAFETRIGEATVFVLLTGIGPARAAAASKGFLAMHKPENQPDICITAGLAGGLHPAQCAGEVLVAQRVRFAADPAREQDPESLRMDEALCRLAEMNGATRTEHFLTRARVASTAAEKQALGRIGDAVEMESFAVAGEATARGARPVAIRAISDAADQDLPYDFNRFFDSTGHLSRVRALLRIAARPHRLPALLRFLRQSRQAAENICEFLDRYVEALVAQRDEQESLEEVAAT